MRRASPWATLTVLVLTVALLGGSLAAPAACRRAQPYASRSVGCRPAGPIAVTPVVAREVAGSYELIVVGGDPEGVAAAVAAARQGLSTLLLDGRDTLGGLMTAGGLNSLDMSYGPGGEILTRGIFLEFYRQIEGDSFDTRTAADVFHRLVNAEPRLTVVQGVISFCPLVEPAEAGGAVRVTGVVYVKDGVERRVLAPMVIDATQDADLAYAAGAPFTLGQEDFGGPAQGMAATLVFELSGVTSYHWLKLRVSLLLQGGRRGWANARSAWGFPELLVDYRPRDRGLQLRGLNLGRQNDGTVLVNALQVFGVDFSSVDSREEARRRAEAELPHVVEHLRRHVPGLERATLAGTAAELYIRESRHLVGEYRLTIDDVLENRDFADRVAFGSYPVDIQAVRPGDPGTVVGAPAKYAVPFRCLVPLGLENLLVVGRSASFDSLAHGSARVIPVGMCLGQAAGTAAALALQEGVGFRELAYSPHLVEELQARLNAQGADLHPFSLPGPLDGHPHAEGTRFLRGLGLVAAGYRNRYGLDEKMPESELMSLLPPLAERRRWPLARPVAVFWEANDLTFGDLAYALHVGLGDVETKAAAVESLRSKGLWVGGVGGRLGWNDPVSRGEVYTLLLEADQWLLGGGA
jgi:hypothetical protein